MHLGILFVLSWYLASHHSCCVLDEGSILLFLSFKLFIVSHQPLAVILFSFIKFFVLFGLLFKGILLHFPFRFTFFSIKDSLLSQSVCFGYFSFIFRNFCFCWLFLFGNNLLNFEIKIIFLSSKSINFCRQFILFLNKIVFDSGNFRFIWNSALSLDSKLFSEILYNFLIIFCLMFELLGSFCYFLTEISNLISIFRLHSVEKILMSLLLIALIIFISFSWFIKLTFKSSNHICFFSKCFFSPFC